MVKNALGLITFVLIVFIPGYSSVISFLKKKTLDSMGLMEFTFSGFACGLLAVSLGAIALAALGFLKVWILLVIVGVYTALVLLLARPKTFWPSKTGLKKDWVVIPVIMLALFLFLLPFRYMLGGNDMGIYVNVAGNLKRTGRITIDEPAMDTLSQAGRENLMWAGGPQGQTRIYDQGIYPFFYLTNKTTMSVVPAFEYMLPADMAVLMYFTSVNVSFLLDAILALLGVLAVYFIGRELFSRKVGILASFLLAISPLQTYFSKRALSEMLTQAMVFLGIYFFIRFIDARRDGGSEAVFLGAAAGALLGSSTLARADALLIVVPVSAWLFYQAYFKGIIRKNAPFVFGFVATTVFGVLVMSLISTPYFVLQMRTLFGSWKKPVVMYPVIAALAAAVILLAILRNRVLSIEKPLREKTAMYIKIAVVALLCVLFVFLMLLHRGPGNLNEFRQWAYYLTWLGLVLAFVGYGKSIMEHFDERSFMLIGIGLVFTLLFAQSLHHVPPELILKMRRLVPEVLPAACIMMAVGTFYIAKLMGNAVARFRKSLRKTVIVASAFILIAALALFLAFPTARVWSLREGTGTYMLVRSMSDDLKSLGGDIILVDKTSGELFSAPLLCFFGLTTFPLRYEGSYSEVFDKVVDGYLDSGRRVFILMLVTPDSPQMIGHLKLVPVKQYLYKDTRLELVTDREPKRVLSWVQQYGIFEIVR